MNGRILELHALAICAALLSSTAATARAQPVEPSVLYVRDLSFDPLKAPPAIHPSLRAAQETGYALVQYHPGQGEAVHRALLAVHARIYGPLARHGFVVGNVELRRIRSIPGVRFAGLYQPAYKLAPPLRDAAIKRGAGKVVVAIDVFENAPRVAKTISAFAKATLAGQQQEHIVAELAERDLGRLAAVPDVRNIEHAMTPKPLLDVMPAAIGVRAAARQPNFEGLDGTGQQLGIYDSGTDTGVSNTLVLDLRNRVSGDIANWTNGTMQPTWMDLDYAGNDNGHGTAVSDVAIGNGATSSAALLTGIALRATALMRPMNADSSGLQPGYLNVTTALTNAYAWGARVHNDSWGPATGTFPNLTPVLNQYSQQASAAIDQYTYTNWQMLVVAAAGNAGPNANTISTLACSKNALTIGNSGNGDPPSGSYIGGGQYDGVARNLMDPSSSVGPVPGGRLKPEVVAPGQELAFVCMAAQVTSGNCPQAHYLNEPNFTYAGGTSVSAPAVSGTALLLRQFLARETQLANPSGMLVKALLVNGAVQILNYAPDNAQGWGLINIQRSIDGFGGGNVYYYDSLTEHGAAFRFVQSGQSVVFENVVLAQGVPLHVTLTWFDPPVGDAGGRLVNDLNLTMTTANGTVYRGGVPSMQNGVTRPNGPVDSVNNTEKLILAATPLAPVTFTVTATVIQPMLPQGFALVVSSVTSHDPQAKSVRPVSRPPNSRATALVRMRRTPAPAKPGQTIKPGSKLPEKPAPKPAPSKPAPPQRR